MATVDECKREVLEISQRLSSEGYFGTKSGTGGNVSMRVEGEDKIVITPSSKQYHKLSSDDLCVLDFNLNQLEGPFPPSVESGMHTAVYKNRQDVNAVVHTHQVYASVFSLLNKPIPALFDEVVVAIGKEVAVVPYSLSGTPDLVNGVANALSNRCNCYLLQNHGALSLGITMEKAFTHTELLEKQAMIYYRALSTGLPVSELPDPLPDALMSFVTNAQDLEIARKKALQAETTPSS